MQSNCVLVYNLEMKYVYIIMALASLLWGIELKSVSGLGGGNSNLALIQNGEALIRNPAFLNGLGLSYSRQSIDTGLKDYDKYQFEYFSYGDLGAGSVTYKEKNGDAYNISLLGFGVPVKDGIKWGCTLETINLSRDDIYYQTWSTKIGISYLATFPTKMLLGFTLENIIKEDSQQTAIETAPKFAFGLGFIPMNNMLWTHSFSYKRKEGEKVNYSTGISLMVDKDLVIMGGASKDGYSVGLELPLGFAKLSNLGKVSYSIVMPFDIKQEIRYNIGYSFGI